MPTRSLAIMFTDIQGFTARVSRGKRDDLKHLLSVHERLLAPVIQYFEGTVVKTIGDSFLVRFESPTESVLCGVTIQEVLRQYNASAPEDQRIEVRVAINTGDVELIDGDVMGEAVNLAARLEGVAEAGEVYFTEAVYLAMNRQEAPSTEVGERTFAGIPYSVRVFKVIRDPNSDLARRTAEGVRVTDQGPLLRGLHEQQAQGISRSSLVPRVIATVAALGLAAWLVRIVIFRPVRPELVPRQTETAVTSKPPPVESPVAKPLAKTARPRTPPATPSTGQVRLNPKDGLPYVWLSHGNFTMGCSPDDAECEPDESPPHEVVLTRGFWIGQSEVTQEAYKRVVGRNPSSYKGSGRCPVNDVTWDDAVEFCEKVGLRLPTEAEWEYAARAGSAKSRYGVLDDIAWYGANAKSEPQRVAIKQPNSWGLYDMLGNVWEWVADSYEDNYYSRSERADPAGPSGGRYHVIRGGSWYDMNPARIRVSKRSGVPLVGHWGSVGFRCAGELP